jgi:hypothetical protein
MLRFSVRDLLWLTLVVAMGLGWFAHQRQLRIRERQLRIEVLTWQTRWEQIEKTMLPLLDADLEAEVRARKMRRALQSLP